MTRHTRADRDLAALLADASPDVAEANAPALAALVGGCEDRDTDEGEYYEHGMVG